jgi:hypothetical protein
MFPDLRSFDEGEDEDDVIERLRTLGRKSAPMDALDPRVTVTNPLDSNIKVRTRAIRTTPISR